MKMLKLYSIVICLYQNQKLFKILTIHKIYHLNQDLQITLGLMMLMLNLKELKKNKKRIWKCTHFLPIITHQRHNQMMKAVM